MAYVKTIEYLDESQQLDSKLMESVNNINKNYLNDSIIQSIQEIILHSIDRRKEARIELKMNYLCIIILFKMRLMMIKIWKMN